MPSTEMPMEVGQSNHDSTAPSPTSTPSHQGNMADAPEASFVMSELGSSVGGQEAASQSSEPTSPHPDFVGGIMRITPAEVNVSSLSLLKDLVICIVRSWYSMYLCDKSSFYQS